MRVASREVTLKNGQKLILSSPLPEEAEVILDYLRILFRESYENMNWPSGHWDHFPVEEEAKVLSDCLNAPKQFMIAARDGERIVGNLGIFPATGPFMEHSAKLGIGLISEFHGQGLGLALMRYSMEIAKSVGLHRIELSVRTYNKAGIALYEKTGFQRVGLLKDAVFIDGTYRDEFLYQLMLT